MNHTSSKECFSKSDKEIDLIDFNRTTHYDQQISNEQQIADLQLKALEEFVSTTSNNNSKSLEIYTSEQEKQFQKFFDKYELDTQYDQTINIKELKNEDSLSHPNKNIKFREYSFPKLIKINDEDLNANEDLIDEVLHEKNLSRPLRNPNHLDRTNYPYCIGNTVLKKNDIKQIITTNNIVDLNTLKQCENNSQESNNKNVVKSTDFTKNDIFNIQGNQSLHGNIKIDDLVNKYNIKYLEAMKKDEKLFQKRSCLNQDKEKIQLTPGPTLYEKSIILPQIMQRLTERKKEVDELTKIKRKHVLDAGPHNHISTGIKDHKESIKSSLRTTESNNEKVPKHHDISDTSCLKQYQEATYERMEKGTVAEINNSFKYLTATPKAELKDIKIHQIESRPGPSYRVSDTARQDVVRPPELLMANCNKERFKNYLASRLFKDYVRDN